MKTIREIYDEWQASEPAAGDAQSGEEVERLAKSWDAHVSKSCRHLEITGVQREHCPGYPEVRDVLPPRADDYEGEIAYVTDRMGCELGITERGQMHGRVQYVLAFQRGVAACRIEASRDAKIESPITLASVACALFEAYNQVVFDGKRSSTGEGEVAAVNALFTGHELCTLSALAVEGISPLKIEAIEVVETARADAAPGMTM